MAYIFKSSYTAHISNIYQLYERALKEQQGGGWGGGFRGGRGVLGGGEDAVTGFTLGFFKIVEESSAYKWEQN